MFLFYLTRSAACHGCSLEIVLNALLFTVAVCRDSPGGLTAMLQVSWWSVVSFQLPSRLTLDWLSACFHVAQVND